MKADVDARGGAKSIRRGESHAAFECGVLDAGEIYGGALACGGARGGFSAGLHAADAENLARREKFDLIVGADAAGDESAGDDGAEAFDGEGAIDGKTEWARCVFADGLCCGGVEFAF